MSAFKEMVENDRKNVFMDINFFGETCFIEGKAVSIVTDDDELKKRQGGQDLALAESATLFYACTDDLPKRRAAGESININGRLCTIDDWQEDMGVSTIALRENIAI